MSYLKINATFRYSCGVLIVKGFFIGEESMCIGICNEDITYLLQTKAQETLRNIGFVAL